MTELDLPSRQSLILTTDAAARGEASALRRASRRGEITSIRRGAYTPADEWAVMSDTQRYLARIAAVRHTRTDAVFSSFSAAALHGLPMIDDWPTAVHIICPSGVGGKNRNGVVEHYRRGDERLVHAGGFVVTSVAQTVVEIARVAGFSTAVAVADAALFQPRFGDRLPACTRAELEWEYRARLPFPGSRKAKAVIDFATSQAETPLESLSRVVIHEEGFAAPTLQHKLWLPHSARWVYLDFGWPEFGGFGEADGNGKYLGSGDLSGMAAAHVVLEEKKREDEVRGLGHGVARWDWSEARGRRALRGKLLDLGIPIVRRPGRVGQPGLRYVRDEPFRAR